MVRQSAGAHIVKFQKIWLDRLEWQIERTKNSSEEKKSESAVDAAGKCHIFRKHLLAHKKTEKKNIKAKQRQPKLAPFLLVFQMNVVCLHNNLFRISSHYDQPRSAHSTSLSDTYIPFVIWK